jgi:hypothetical protein
MLSFRKKRIAAFFFTALVTAPVFFFTPLPFGGSEAHAELFNSPFVALTNVLTLFLLPLVYLFFVAIPKLFFGLASIVFDTLIAFSLSSQVIQNQEFVNKGWVIMRDFSNTFFIFILLYIAISAILQLAGGQTKRLLATLVMVALFMNFSLYITKFVIDVGNVFALEFYSNIGVSGLAYIDLPDVKPHSIAASFKNAFDLEKVGGSFLDKIMNPTKAAFTMIILGILYLVSTFVFLSAGFLFLARVVAFWFLMILSPLAFFSMILPYTRGKIWSRWISELISQSFFAPIFLFFVYLALIFIQTASNLLKFNPSALNKDVDWIILLILSFLNVFAIVTILLFGLKTAKGMSGELGASMLKIGGVATGAAVGGAALAGRNTLGRAARYANDKLGRDLEKSRLGRAVQSGLNTVSNSSFDARASKMGQMAQGIVGEHGGINLGAAGGPKGGHAGVVAEKQKDLADHTKKLLAKDPVAAASYLATHEILGDRDTAAAMASMTYAERAELIANAKPGKERDRLARVNQSLGKGLTPRQQWAERKGVKEYEKTVKKEAREIEQEKRVADMKAIQSKFTEAKNIAEKDTAKAEAKEFLNQMRGEEIADLGGELLSSDIVAHHLSDKDLEQIERKSNLTKGHQEALYANIKANGRQEAKDYLNLSPSIKRKMAAKERKLEDKEKADEKKEEQKKTAEESTKKDEAEAAPKPETPSEPKPEA